MYNILSFDIEEWFVYRSLLGDFSSDNRLEKYLDIILHTLSNHNINATFFVLGAIARSHPYIVRKIFNAGHEIGCHSDVHKWITDLNESQFEADTNRAISSIEDVIGSKVLGYRAPAFSITSQNKWAFEILKKYGIEYDCSIFPAERDFGGFENFQIDTPAIIEYNGMQIKEFPIGITEIFWKKIAYSGGGYFRLLPYERIKKIISSREYNMTYFHLRDFDKEQTRRISTRYFKEYYGIGSSMIKFQQLINDFSFMNIAQANTSTNWDIVSSIKI